MDVPAPQRDHAGDVRAVFDELNWSQLAILARLTPARRLQIMFDRCEFSRQMIVAAERQRQPHSSNEELIRRVQERIELSYGR